VPDPIQLPFGAWLPDLPANNNPGALIAKNCIPGPQSYRELRSLASFTDALDGPAKGVFWARNESDTVFAFAGDMTKLYLLDASTSWTDVSQAATTYSADFWDFVTFENRVLATDGSSNIQFYDLGLSTTFDDLAGSPPHAKVIGVVRDFVVLGNIRDDATFKQDAIAWSGFNNTELWTPSRATQSDRLSLRGNGGAVRRVVGGQTGFIFQENSVQKMDYVGPPTVFRIDEFATSHGTNASRAVTATKDYVFYYAMDGFYRLDRRTLEIRPLSADRNQDWFTHEIAPAEIFNMVGAAARLHPIIYWVFRTSSSVTNYDRMLIYNWVADRFSYAEIETQFIGGFASTGANLDTLDTVLGGDIDAASIPVDTNAFAGGVLDLIAFDSDNQAAAFEGPALVAEFDTTEFGGSGDFIYLDHLRPIVDSAGGTVEVAPLTRNGLSATPVLGSFVSLNRLGNANVRTNRQYHRYRVRITGGFEHAQRVEFEPQARGSR